MISPDAMIVALFIMLGYQQWFYSRQIQKLVDKLMSRNFHEYKGAENPPTVFRTNPEPEPPEDLRILQEFSLT